MATRWEKLHQREARLSHARLLELLDYDLETGIFTWKKKPANRANRVKVGEPAGFSDGSEHIFVGIDGEKYYAHRLAWFYVKGVWPEEEIDHKDTDGHNNRLNNLRECTHAQNMINRSSVNETGYRGVYQQKQCIVPRWCAGIVVDKKKIYLGSFETPEAAHAAYCSAAKKYHGEFARFA